jgi:uncharacterized membrane protein YfhO
VLLSRPPSRPLPQGGTDYSQASQPDPTVWRETHGRVAIKVNMIQPGYLVLTDTYYPGWQATVDEQPVQILVADHAFRAVTLGPGEHMVIFEYAPLSFRIGAWISLAAALLLVISLVTGGCRARALSCARRQTGL